MTTNTPITDAETRHVFQWDSRRGDYKAAGIMVDANLARRLETDRAALMEALEKLMNEARKVDSSGYSEHWRLDDLCEHSQYTLSAAHANFPHTTP